MALACTGSTVPCGDRCANPASDRDNCGGCGKACTPDQDCVSGKCQLRCTGLSDCNGACVNLQDDVANCGACGTACPSGDVCSGGKCTLTCKPGLVDCNGDCADLMTDLANCGACGAACAAGQLCSDGKCALSCTSNETACNGSCTDTTQDANNCGGCGLACPAGQQCIASTCQCPSLTPDTCGSGAGAFCTSLKSDPTNCGACGVACTVGQACSSGKCVADCAMPLVACSGACVDPRFDPMNCGGCGKACATRANASSTCASSTCGYACNAGYLDCDGNASNGCEVDGNSDANNCGACNDKCAAPASATATCASRTCGYACLAPYLDCNGSAGDGCEVNGATDVDNCGACANQCVAPANATATCASRQCGYACTSGFLDCNGKAGDGCEVNSLTDGANCGGCGKACATGVPCVGGACAARGTQANPGTSCLDILNGGGSTGSGTYWLNPGGGAFQDTCDMATDGGGWTQLIAQYTTQLPANVSRKYLYVYNGRWYESPTTTLTWTWSSGQQLVGTYSFWNGSSGGTFSCGGSGEVPQWGVGCSNGGGGTYKVLPYYADDPTNGRVEICQDQPNAFGVGACTGGANVNVFVR